MTDIYTLKMCAYEKYVSDKLLAKFCKAHSVTHIYTFKMCAYVKQVSDKLLVKFCRAVVNTQTYKHAYIQVYTSS